MMFASDLDRTLIFSNRALNEFPSNETLVGVEKKDEKFISYMTVKAMIELQNLSEKILFVPVTTRSQEQFSRILIFQELIPLDYAITSNGAVILHRGKPIKEWGQEMKQALTEGCASVKELEHFLKGFEIGGKLKPVEDLFLQYLLENTIEPAVKSKLKEAITPLGWRISHQGRKLYLMPNPISKGKAVEYIKQKENIQTVVGAGDSLFDWDFLKCCDDRLIPSHGELASEEIELENSLTSSKGIEAGEEILLRVAESIPSRG